MAKASQGVRSKSHNGVVGIPGQGCPRLWRHSCFWLFTSFPREEWNLNQPGLADTSSMECWEPSSPLQNHDLTFAFQCLLPTHWFTQHHFDHGVKGGVMNYKSDCFPLVQAQRALMQRDDSLQNFPWLGHHTDQMCGPSNPDCHLWCDCQKERHKGPMGR